MCIHTVTEYRTGWLGMRVSNPTARRITTISDGGARRGHDPRDRRSGSGRARPDAAWDHARCMATVEHCRAVECRAREPVYNPNYSSAHVKKTSFESVSA
jgi:hypothetical protein